mmetsp:Transcript_17964/g.45383  ORF Transcript_17964/g.45383 Transcript_17964/m.45383 type:complete len:209 (+) Transcript_17964:757-1383(+)
MIHTRVVERPITEKQLEGDHPEAPAVSELVVAAAEDLRGHVLHRADDLMQTTGSLRHQTSSVKVEEPHDELTAAGAPGETNILGLDIPMHPTLGVDVLQTLQDLREHMPGRPLRDPPWEPLAEQCPDCAVGEVLEASPDLIACEPREVLPQGDNVPALRQCPQCLHLRGVRALERELLATRSAAPLHQEHRTAGANAESTDLLPAPSL